MVCAKKTVCVAEHFGFVLPQTEWTSRTVAVVADYLVN